jgi:hypothetical protein
MTEIPVRTPRRKGMRSGGTIVGIDGRPMTDPWTAWLMSSVVATQERMKEYWVTRHAKQSREA